MKTIKIIDLLNKIANGEELPKLKLEHSSDNDVGYELYMKIGETNGDNFEKCLNDEIEIIEEEKEIEKIDMSSPISVVHCAMKINELIDVVTELKGKSD